MEFHSHTLDNGLEVVAECNASAHSSAVGFFVKTGSRDESEELAGVSHFLEHMVFKGTPTRTADQVNREFDELGAHYNAFTSEENTVYYAAFLPEYTDRIVALLSDIMRPSLRSEDFDTEKKVIIEEIRMYDDQPPFGADEKCKVAFFRAHPLGHSVLGTVQSITALSVDQMHGYFRHRYSPKNLALVGAGRVDFDHLVSCTEKVCGRWEAVDGERTIEPARPQAGFQCIEKATAVQEYTVQLSPAPSATDPDRYAAKVLTTVLGDESGSRLYWELTDPGRAEQVSVGHYDYLGTGVYGTYMSCAPENAADNLQRIHDLFRHVENDSPVEAAELNQAKRKTKSRIVLASERPRSRLFNVGANWIQRREYRSVRNDLEEIEAVSLDEVAAVVAKYPLSSSMTICIGPLKDMATPA